MWEAEDSSAIGSGFAPLKRSPKNAYLNLYLYGVQAR